MGGGGVNGHFTPASHFASTYFKEMNRDMTKRVVSLHQLELEFEFKVIANM